MLRVQELRLYQKAVLWDGVTNNGYGGYTYNSPTEINCRWEDKVEEVKDNKGELKISVARVYLTQSISINAYLYKGELIDVSGQNPETVLRAYRALKIDTQDSLDGNSTLQVVYL